MYNYLPTHYCPCMQCMHMRSRALYWQDMTYNQTTELTKDIKNKSKSNLKADTIENTEEIDNAVPSKENIEDLNTSSLNPNDNMTPDNEKVNDILSRIEKEDPMVIRTLISYGIPHNITEELVRRIIPLTS
ncbi:hypothetical protein [Clostridium sp. DJ247]|uniref:hypothetical protein n=1 Tax=Clostridium sp. DJ247 TaxID=2726188 RepID=UPI001626396E|nr:hypothetical protein [Clostridium sp. DJ247]MBC2580015.1 hypothetical protein [Clostridium sp. DJ247]